MKLIPNLAEVLDGIEDREREAEVALVANANSLDFLRAIYFDPGQPISRRMRAAIAALPFEQPKLAVVASMTASDSFAAKLEAAIVRSGKMIEGEWTSTLSAQPSNGSVADPEGSGDVG